ncbi:MAG TPA: prepilin peptidase [Candidatus Rubrimentiphilum sp.]|nr:prepilin peptidase [Candidatus Rubrimentiphilum sp.]
MITAAILGAIFFAAAGYAGAVVGLTLAERIEPLDDAPESGRPPIVVLIAACASIGAIVTTGDISQMQFLLIAVICAVLVAIWVADVKRGIVPDALTLGPLALLALIAIWQHQWVFFISVAAPFAPFAIAAALSHGRGMGWGDVKLVALGGAVLGAEAAFLAFALACVAAVIVSFARGRRTGPIAFAPYLAAAIGLAIPIGVIWSV